jgi:glycosyltransferase involved in cell wall biosynthesis
MRTCAWWSGLLAARALDKPLDLPIVLVRLRTGERRCACSSVLLEPGGRMRSAKLMKIAHLTSAHLALDQRIFWKEAVTLAAAGHDVVVVAAAGAQDTTVRGVRIRPVTVRGSRWQRMTATTVAVLRAALAERADVHHFHDPELIPAGLLLKALGRRVIYDVHEDVPAQVLSKAWISPGLRPLVARAVGTLESLGARLFDGIIVANPPQRWRFPQGKIEVVRNLPILEEFAGGPSVPYASRAPSIAYVGDLTHVRGAKEMIQAIALVPGELQARLCLAGRFSDAGLEETCRALPGWSRVDFLGWQSRSEVAALLGRARVGLVLLQPVPHYLTNYPVKLFEYMAAGLPVVASDLPNCRQVVEETGCGLMVDALDPAAIADAVQRLLEDPIEAEEMGRRGRRAVEERYNWSSEGQNLVRYYERFRRCDGSASRTAAGPASQNR